MSNPTNNSEFTFLGRPRLVVTSEYRIEKEREKTIRSPERVTERIAFHPNGQKKEWLLFNPDGSLFSAVRYKDTGEVLETQEGLQLEPNSSHPVTTVTDDELEAIKKRFPTREHEDRYVHDSVGNWTQLTTRVAVGDFELLHVTKRAIEYY